MTVFSARLSQPALSAAPGGVVACDLRLRNASDRPVAVRVEARGRAGAWATVRPEKMQVPAGAEALAQLTFTVPDSALTAGESVGFTVRVVGDRSLDVPGRIQIAERRDVRLRIHPLISQDGRHEVVLTNRGNVAALVTLAAEDEDEDGAAAAVRLGSRVVVVEPGEESRVDLAVSASRRVWGRRPRPHRVVVSAGQDGMPGLDAAAVWFQRPVRLKAAAVMVVGAMLCGLAVALAGGTVRPAAAPAPAAATAVPSNCPEVVEEGVVAISTYAYCPGTITVAAGTDVRWRNDDMVPHSATVDGDGEGDGDGGFDTGLLRRGGTATVRFDRPGTYAYYCTIHPAMRGTVVVTA